MHLDTVFTMVDQDKFTVHPNIQRDLRCSCMEPGQAGQSEAFARRQAAWRTFSRSTWSLDKVTLIPCGGGSDDRRSPGAVERRFQHALPSRRARWWFTSRNEVTNHLLREARRARCWTIPSAELSRGRGGPRCMTMPLVGRILTRQDALCR